LQLLSADKVFLIKPAHYEGKARSQGTYLKPKIKLGGGESAAILVARRFLPTGLRVQDQANPWMIFS
jgi:hypothetical protein